MCGGLWDCLSLEDQNKTFSRRRVIRIGTVEMAVGRKPVLPALPVLSGTDGLFGDTTNSSEQKVWMFVLLKTVTVRLQALSVAQPIPAITKGKRLLFPTAKKKTQELVSSLLSSALKTHMHWERKLCSEWSRVHDFFLLTEMHELISIPSMQRPSRSVLWSHCLLPSTEGTL